METKLFTTEKSDIILAAAIISKGGLVAFPTETVYGLGADAFNPDAARAIYAAKGRPSDNPLIVHIAQLEEICSLAAFVPSDVYKLAERFWPGPLTLVLEKKLSVPDETTGGLSTVAIRMPDNEAALSLIYESKTSIAAPSANFSGGPSPTTWTDVLEDMNGRVDAIIMGEPCTGGIESTVLDCSGEQPAILRPGLITPEEISAILNKEINYDPAILAMFDQGLKAKSPGMKYKHYSPRAEMLIFSGTAQDVKQAIEQRKKQEELLGKSVGILIYDEKDSRTMAREFFSKLREMDRTGVNIILAAALPTEDSLSFSVMNRMLKAAGYKVEEV
ncbi:MAG: threonylcarbamoyl-AMP synthase [Clostridia bacterium]|nr:threonylcarbamoyl-AMP synthase [Clostridia bacterium]